MKTITLSFYPESPAYKSGIAIKGTPEKLYFPQTSWCGPGVFVQAFEAYFDNQHPFFSGTYAHNIGAAIAATGHMYYYLNKLKLQNRGFTIPFNGQKFPDEESMLEINNLAAMQRRSFCFGNELLCNVPPQLYIVETDMLAQKHYSRIQNEKPGNVKEAKFLKSFTVDALKRLYTWGYLTAAEIAPANSHNQDTFDNFLKVFEEITIYHRVEALLPVFRELEITFHPGDRLQWNAHFITNGNHKVHYTELRKKK